MCQDFNPKPDLVNTIRATDGTQYIYRGIWTPIEGELYLDGARIAQATDVYPDSPKAIFVKMKDLK